MSKKTWGSVVFLIIIAFVFVIIYSNNKVDKIDEKFEREQAKEDLVLAPKTTINIKHQYKDGTHTYIGNFTTPTPCHLHDTNILKPIDDEPYVIEITHEPSPEEICVQVITDKEFRISFEAEENIDVIASINGETVNLNIFEVSDSQSLEEFDFLNKG
jgi:hypothetical protein